MQYKGVEYTNLDDQVQTTNLKANQYFKGFTPLKRYIDTLKWYKFLKGSKRPKSVSHQGDTTVEDYGSFKYYFASKSGASWYESDLGTFYPIENKNKK